MKNSKHILLPGPHYRSVFGFICGNTLAELGTARDHDGGWQSFSGLKHIAVNKNAALVLEEQPFTGMKVHMAAFELPRDGVRKAGNG